MNTTSEPLKLGYCHVCEAEVDLDDLQPYYQVVLAMQNMQSVLTLVDMLVRQPSQPESTQQGWYERLYEIRDWLAKQTDEVREFGEAFDSDDPIES